MTPDDLSFPGQPDDPEFWTLASITLKHDADPEAALADCPVPVRTLQYMALQRAFRVLGVTTLGQAVERATELARYSAIYVDGFLTGAEYAR